MKHLIILLLFCTSITVSAIDKVDRKAQWARDKAGKVIICSPKGGNGTLTLEEAMKELRAGDILRLLPGRYAEKNRNDHQNLQLLMNDITVESDQSGRPVTIDLDFRGRNGIVRNIYLAGHLEAEGITIVDSRLNPMICNSDKFSTSYIYNCYVTGASVYANNAQIYFKRCTFFRTFNNPEKYSYITKPQMATWKVGGGGGGDAGGKKVSGVRGGYGAIISLGQMAGKGGIDFNHCIFYTNGYLLYNKWSIKSLSLSFTNNLIISGQGIMYQGIWGTENIPADILETIKKTTKIVKVSHTDADFKSAGQCCSVTYRKNYFVKPETIEHPNAIALGHIDIPKTSSTTAQLELGANLGANFVPFPRNNAQLVKDN